MSSLKWQLQFFPLCFALCPRLLGICTVLKVKHYGFVSFWQSMQCRVHYTTFYHIRSTVFSKLVVEVFLCSAPLNSGMYCNVLNYRPMSVYTNNCKVGTRKRLSYYVHWRLQIVLKFCRSSSMVENRMWRTVHTVFIYPYCETSSRLLFSHI
jgi:hypothetical protein